MKEQKRRLGMKKRETGRVLLGGGDPDAPGIVPDLQMSEGERKELSYAIVPGDFAGNRSDCVGKRIRVPDGVRERGRSLHTARLKESRKRRLFRHRSKKYRIGKTPFSMRTNSLECAAKEEQKSAALLSLRRENENGGRNLQNVFED